MDTRLPQPAGCGDKYDVDCLCFKRLFNICSKFFKYPSPDTNVSTSPARGEVKTNILHNGLDVVRQYAALLERSVQNSTRVRKAQVVTRQKNKYIETAESGVDKEVSSYEKNPSVHKRYMNFLRQRKTALDAPLYAVSYGRSMIEMLGVLAIIAVLSVGGIAGYSKAMNMWRINKATEEYTNIIYNLLSNLDEARNQKYENPAAGINLFEYVKATDIVPKNWKNNSNNQFIDQYGNVFAFIHRYNIVVIDMYIGGSKPLNNGSASLDSFYPQYCATMLRNVAKPLSSILNNVWFIINGRNAGIYYGDNYCVKGKNCIRNMNMSTIKDICLQCTNNNSFCGIIWEF